MRRDGCHGNQIPMDNNILADVPKEKLEGVVIVVEMEGGKEKKTWPRTNITTRRLL